MMWTKCERHDYDGPGYCGACQAAKIRALRRALGAERVVSARLREAAKRGEGHDLCMFETDDGWTICCEMCQATIRTDGVPRPDFRFLHAESCIYRILLEVPPTVAPQDEDTLCDGGSGLMPDERECPCGLTAPPAHIRIHQRQCLVYEQQQDITALRARLAEVEAERDAERFRFQALCMASGLDGRCQHGNVNDEARDMLCLWCAQEDTLRRERDAAHALIESLRAAVRTSEDAHLLAIGREQEALAVAAAMREAAESLIEQAGYMYPQPGGSGVECEEAIERMRAVLEPRP